MIFQIFSTFPFSPGLHVTYCYRVSAIPAAALGFKVRPTCWDVRLKESDSFQPSQPSWTELKKALLSCNFTLYCQQHKRNQKQVATYHFYWSLLHHVVGFSGRFVLRLFLLLSELLANALLCGWSSKEVARWRGLRSEHFARLASLSRCLIGQEPALIEAEKWTVRGRPNL